MLSHTDVLARVAAACCRVSSHIAVVHLVDYDLRCGNYGSSILVPTLGVSVVEVDDSSAVAIYVQRACEDTSGLLQRLAVNGNLKGVVEALLIAIGSSGPEAIICGSHCQLLDHLIAVVQTYDSALGCGGPHLESGLLGRVVHL